MHITPLFVAEDPQLLAELERQYTRRQPNVDDVRLDRLVRADGQPQEPSYLVSFEQGQVASGYLVWMN